MGCFVMLWSILLTLGSVRLPGGGFRQGNAREPDAPARQVQIRPFRIDRTEVSISTFEAWAELGYQVRDPWSAEGWAWAQEHPGGAGPELRAAGREPTHPVVAVTWYEAEAYCRAQGGGLPTEAQWEYAACGDGSRRYPWGDSEDVDVAWYSYGKHGQVPGVDTWPVDQQRPELRSPHGLLHTAGNVWEWTADWYHRDGTQGDAVDPTGPSEGTWRVLKGGSYTSLPSYCACAHREPAEPDRVAFTTGFRCAYPDDQPTGEQVGEEPSP